MHFDDLTTQSLNHLVGRARNDTVRYKHSTQVLKNDSVLGIVVLLLKGDKIFWPFPSQKMDLLD